MDIQSINNMNFKSKLYLSNGINAQSAKMQNVTKIFEEITKNNKLDLTVEKKENGIVRLIAGIPEELKFIFCDLGENISKNFENFSSEVIADKCNKFVTQAKHEMDWKDWVKSTIITAIRENRLSRDVIKEFLSDKNNAELHKNPIIKKFINNMGEFNANAAPEVREEVFGKDLFFNDATMYLN